jgi:hypothetical protein
MAFLALANSFGLFAMVKSESGGVVSGQSVVLGGWTLTITAEGVELTAPGKIDLTQVVMKGDKVLVVRVKK